MVRSDFMTLKTDQVTAELIDADTSDLKMAIKRLFDHATKLGGLGYLLILDRTNWRSNMLTSLLVPYIFFSLPGSLFHFLRGQFGMWIAFIAVVLRLFFPQNFPDWLELPGSLVLLLTVSPSLFSHTFRGGLVGVVICLLIGCYLLQEHVRASGGFRNSFMQSHGVSNTIGILLLLIYPMWRLIIHFI